MEDHGDLRQNYENNIVKVIYSGLDSFFQDTVYKSWKKRIFSRIRYTDSPVLRPMLRMHRHQLAPSGVKRRAALARRNSLPAGTASHTEDQPVTS